MKNLKLIFKKNPGFHLIDITGLSFGISLFLVLITYSAYELSFDKYHKNSDRIFRIHRMATMATPLTAHPYAEALKSEYPEIENAVRFHFRNVNIVSQANERTVERVSFVDPSMFKVFSWKLLYGVKDNSLRDPNQIVLTIDEARKQFGRKPYDDIINSSIEIEIDNTSIICEIVGIVDNIPKKSHFSTKIFVSYETLKNIYNEDYNNWFFNSTYTYVLLNKHENKELIESKLPKFLSKYLGDKIQNQKGNKNNVYNQYKLWLFPLEDIHLHSNLGYEIQPNSDFNVLIILCCAALLVLLIALFNHTNLNISLFETRKKELIIKKILGADKQRLFLETSSLSVFKIMLAISISIGIVVFLDNTLYEYFQISITEELAANHYLIFILAVIFSTAIIFCSVYPTLKLSRIKTSEISKFGASSNKSSNLKYTFLIALQLITSVLLIAFFITINQQLDYMQKKNLGFGKLHKLVIEHNNPDLIDKKNFIKSKLVSFKGVNQVSFASTSLCDPYYSKQGFFNPKTMTSDDFIGTYLIPIDEDFISTMQMTLIAGNNFISNESDLKNNGIILNETAIRQFGFKTPSDALRANLNQIVDYRTGESITKEIIGVVKDFHFQSLHESIKPAILIFNPNLFSKIIIDLVATESLKVEEIISEIKQISSHTNLDYYFIDQQLESIYNSEYNTRFAVFNFSLVGSILAIFGVITLSIFTLNQKRKEFSIRKTLGASNLQLFNSCALFFLKPLLLTIPFSMLIIHLLMNNWMNQFEYKPQVTMAIFLIPIGIVGVLIIVATSIQTLNAIKKNPIEWIRQP
ncbi:MAG: ABC transporter permease [Fulvivirga sp.]|uniref:ABC transporter permease n=1 Tax=Fulvivirga sp. TaxID=1931237 RepID=UPI0032F02ED1